MVYRRCNGVRKPLRKRGIDRIECLPDGSEASSISGSPPHPLMC